MVGPSVEPALRPGYAGGMETTDSVRRPSFGERLREKLPEILIEACSVALAVVLALWASQWRDNRELDRDAAQRKQAVAAEIRGNLAELESARPMLQKNLDTARNYLKPETAEKTRSLEFNLQLSLLSAAAWNTAQSAESARRLESDWAIPVARTYELQALYQRQQELAMDTLAGLGAEGEDQPPSRRGVREMAHSIGTLIELNEQLASAYKQRL